MAEMQPAEVVLKTPDKVKLGRNQKIGLGMWAGTMVLTFAFMAFGAFKTAPETLPGVLSTALATWVGFVTPFTAIAMGVILGGSAGLKVAEIFASKGKGAPR